MVPLKSARQRLRAVAAARIQATTSSTPMKSAVIRGARFSRIGYENVCSQNGASSRFSCETSNAVQFGQ